VSLPLAHICGSTHVIGICTCAAISVCFRTWVTLIGQMAIRKMIHKIRGISIHPKEVRAKHKSPHAGIASMGGYSLHQSYSFTKLSQHEQAQAQNLGYSPTAQSPLNQTLSSPQYPPPATNCSVRYCARWLRENRPGILLRGRS
jgi:hypothetical protein